ncbi:MAG: glycosyltransferase family 4 protein [Pseudomonadota bacterium]
MKIAHLLATGGWGGAEGLACALAERAQQQGHVVSVDAAPLAQAGLSHRGFSGAGQEATLASWARAARKRLTAFAPDLVHVHLSTPAFAATAMLASRGFRGLVSLHLLPEKSWPNDFLTGLPSYLTLLAGAQLCPRWLLVAVSRSDRLRLKPWFGSGVRAVPNAPLALREDESDASDRAFQGASLKLLSVGRLEVQKGLDRLLAALAGPALAALNFRLLLVGDGEQRAELARIAQRLGLGERVQFLGASRWQRAARAADLLICPSRYEGMPLTPMEGVLAGCPVIASPIPAHRELFGAISGSLLPERERDWPGFLRPLLADPERRACLGRAQKTLAPFFSFERMWDGYQLLYDELAGLGAGTSNRPLRDR